MIFDRSGTQTITLDPAKVQEILNLSRDHDEQLKEARQDLVRAETRLLMERQWKWPVIAASAGAGALMLVGLQMPGVMPKVSKMLAATADYGWSVATGDFVFGDVPLPVSFVAAVTIGLVSAMYLLAVAIKTNSPRNAARKLVGGLADVADSIGAPTEHGGGSALRLRIMPATPSLAESVTSMLHRPAHERRLALVC
jgi:hypothetical protein